MNYGFCISSEQRLNADAHTRETHSSRCASIGGCSECISNHGICMRQICIPTSDFSSQLNDKKFLLEYSRSQFTCNPILRCRKAVITRSSSRSLVRLLARAASKVAPFFLLLLLRQVVAFTSSSIRNVRSRVCNL